MSHYSVFCHTSLLTAGPLAEVTQVVREALASDPSLAYLAFDDATGQVQELDIRSNQAEAPSSPPKQGPGRPKLGVVAREVTLLPRHWDWLARQPGGASVALRKLVETASRANRARDTARASLEACHRVMMTLAGDMPGFEEASRALFAGDFAGVRQHITVWPQDIRLYTETLLERAQHDAYEARED